MHRTDRVFRPVPAVFRQLSRFLLLTFGACLAVSPAAAFTPRDAAAPDGSPTLPQELPVPRLVGSDAVPLAGAGARALAPEAAGGGEAAPSSGAVLRSRERVRASRAAFGALAGEGAPAWRVRWNEWTGLPHRAYGVAPSIGAGLVSQSRAEAAARAFLESRPPMWAGEETPAREALALVKARRVGETWFLVFGQRFHGVTVEGGRVDLRLTVDGRVVLVGSDYFPGVSLDVTPRLAQGVADARARGAVGFDAARDRFLGGERAILPMPGVDGAIDYRLVWRVQHRVEDPPALWRTYVDASDGTILARENDLRYATLTGQVRGRIHPATPTDALLELPFENHVVATALDSAFTNASGNYALPGVNTGDPVRVGLRGPFLEVFHAAQNNASQQIAAPGSGPLDFVWTPANSDTAERDAFYHALVAHDYVKAIEPGFTGLDYRVPCTVNLNSVCNAYWDGVGINFFHWGKSGATACANTGEIADVIYHEYGHGRTQFVWDPFFPSGAMHEGLSDYLAATITNQSVIGRGFFGPGTSIRNTSNTIQANDPACAGEVHCVGNAVSGSLWDMRTALIAALGSQAAGVHLADSLFHFAGYGGAPWHDDYLLDLLVVDDNDGNLLNGTPHFGQICPAFSAHGIPCPDTTSGVWIAHTTRPDASLSDPDYPVDATMGSFANAFLPASAVLHWRPRGGTWQDVAMAPTGGDGYRGVIPQLVNGGRVDYYLSAEDGGGLSATSPAGAPAASHTFYVGALSTFFADDFDSGDKGWQSVIEGALTGRWMRVDPHGTFDPSDPTFLYAPENDHTPGGTVCYVTQDTTAGLPVGTADVDGGCVSLISPALNLSSLGNARLTYWRWYTDETRYDDTLSVAVSADNGTTWTEIDGQTFTENTWTEHSFDLGAYMNVPSTTQFRFRVRACDLGGGSLVEAGLDDFAITTRATLVGVPGDGGADGGPALAFLGPIAPNPARTGSAASVSFGVPGAAGGGSVPVTVQVLDARGRIVRTLVSGPASPGPHRAAWDGRTEGGTRAPAGLYFVRYRVAASEWTRKAVRLE